MGQIVWGVMWGAEIPADVDLWGDDGSDPLIEQWQRASGEARAKYRVDTTDESDRFLVGYWVLCDHGDEKGVKDLDGTCVVLATVPSSKAHKKAQAAWKRFAAWMKKRGVTFPKPQLWLAPTEVA